MKPTLHRILHYTTYLLAAVVMLVSGIALVLRFVIMPDIDRYKPEIEGAASRAVGVPVRIAAIEADWWRLNPRFSLRELSLVSPGHPAPLVLGRVDATLSWLSLVLFEPHLSRLDIVRPSLEIRQDKAGVIYVADIPVNVPSAPSPFPDWLLRQRSVTVSEGRLIWKDEAIDAPPLILEQVNLRVENHFSRHRFGLTARPPAAAARHLDLRGDLKGDSVHRPRDWKGRLYARVDGASAEALHAWAPWAQQSVKHSTGDMRSWLTLDQGSFQGLTGDVSLSGVSVSLAEDLPDMSFRRVSGRLGWQRGKTDHTFFVENLRFVTAAGLSPEPADIRVVVKPDSAGKAKEATVTVDRLRLETLTALSGAVPMPRRGHDWLESLNPRGFVEHTEIAWLGKTRFRIKSRFRDVGIATSPSLPGFTGLTGELEADESRGRIRLDSAGLRFVHDAVFRQPLDFDRLKAELAWTVDDRAGYRFDLAGAEIANADLEGHVRGSVAWKPGSAPLLDIQGRLTRGRGDAVWRYLPRQVGDATHDWVRHSILGGTSPDTRLVLRGPADLFPFDRGGGEFRVDVQMRDGVLEYAKDWPRITAVNGLLTFRDKAMLIHADSAQSAGVQLGPVDGLIPDLHHAGADLTLSIEGRAAGPAAAFLDFIRRSPVHEHTERFTEDTRVSGNAQLQLRLELPLDHIDDSTVAGRLALAGNQVVLGRDFPVLENVRGDLEFNRSSIRGNDLAARLYGHPVAINLANEQGGRVRATLRGTLAAATLANWLPASLARRLTGSAAYQAEVGLRQGKTSLNVTSNLAGLAVDLPAPLGKKAEQPLPTTLSTRESGGETLVNLQYGGIMAAALARDEKGESRAGVMFGGQQAQLPRGKGLLVRGSLQRLDLDAWRRAGFDAADGGGNGLAVRDINMTFNELTLLNRQLRDINIQAYPLNPGWQIRVAGQEAIGELEYAPLRKIPGHRLQGRFKKLVIHRPGRDARGGHDPADQAELPGEVDITAESLVVRDRELGAFTLRLSQERGGMRIDAFSLVSPDARLDGGGWLSVSPLRQTEFNLRLVAGNTGRLLARLGYPEDVKGGELDVFGTVNWLGGADDFRLDQLGGKLKVQVKRGRFTQLDPGAAKLLLILSLQALPKRVVLDFRDVFSEGFIFDEIQGDVHLDRGIGYLPEFRIAGPSARVRMNGKIDLARERQELRLHIQPRVDESVAMASALLGGPILGVGTYVASKILKEPFAKAASFEYLVNGTWEDPLVRKLGRPAEEATSTPP